MLVGAAFELLPGAAAECTGPVAVQVTRLSDAIRCFDLAERLSAASVDRTAWHECRSEPDTTRNRLLCPYPGQHTTSIGRAVGCFCDCRSQGRLQQVRHSEPPGYGRMHEPITPPVKLALIEVRFAIGVASL